MAKTVPNSVPNSQAPSPKRITWLRPLLLQIVRMVVVGTVVGWLYAWGAPLIYQQKNVPGFWLGCAHGALMPMALPSLLMDKDVSIYATVNQGRIYKIGYIAGINGCGILMFGLTFGNHGENDGSKTRVIRRWLPKFWQSGYA